MGSTLACASLALIAVFCAAAEEETADVTDHDWTCFGETVPDSANALRFVIDACATAAKQHAVPKDRATWEARRPHVKRTLAAALGLDPMPPRSPLNARIMGSAELEGCRVENVVFESRPNFLVTANVFIPDEAALPAPGIVVVPGHAMEDGKNYGLYLQAQLGLARLGCVVLGYDPIGQGERKKPGFDHKLGYGSLLVGQTNEGYIVWDTLRALDYLAAREDVDASRLGLCGNSGGGENTVYAMPFDDRLKAGASFCFTCSYDAWVREGGNHCICNHMPGLVQHMEEFEVIGLNAPRAFLAGNGAEDPIFPIAGTRQAVADARSVYALYDAQDRVASVEAPLAHGWSLPLREAAYGWMNRWLLDQGDGAPMPETPATIPEGPDMLCYDGAGIPVDSETVVSLNRARAEAFRDGHVGPGALPDAVWACLGGQPEDTEPVARTVGAFAWNGCHVEKLVLTTEPGMDVPALFLRPDGAADLCPAVLYLGAADKAAVREDSVVAALLASGCAVLALDPRGMGETARGFVENHLVSDGVFLGRSVFAQRVWDVMQSLGYLASRPDVAGRGVSIHGREGGGLLAVYAAALGAPAACVTTDRMLAGYRYFLEDAQPQPIWLCVPGILRVTDIPNVASLLGERLLLRDPIGYGLEPLSNEIATTDFADNISAKDGTAEAMAEFLLGGR